MFETILIWSIVALFVVGLIAAVLELRRIGDLLEAVNNAIERIAVAARKR